MWIYIAHCHRVSHAHKTLYNISRGGGKLREQVPLQHFIFFRKGRLCSSNRRRGRGRLCHGTMASPSLILEQFLRKMWTTASIERTPGSGRSAFGHLEPQATMLQSQLRCSAVEMGLKTFKNSIKSPNFWLFLRFLENLKNPDFRLTVTAKIVAFQSNYLCL